MEHLLKVRKSSVVEEPVQRIIIGVAGGSAAGKTTLCENINRQMAFDRNFKVQMVSLDSFYKSKIFLIKIFRSWIGCECSLIQL
jgi:pantothenate kinase